MQESMTDERYQQLENGLTVVVNMRYDQKLISYAKDRQIYARIDRATKWGNPFVISERLSRDDVCDQYRDKIIPTLDQRDAIRELMGKALGCWCWPERCHGTELALWINKMKKEKIE